MELSESQHFRDSGLVSTVVQGIQTGNVNIDISELFQLVSRVQISHSVQYSPECKSFVGNNLALV